jgi:hypothetical protein
MTNWRTLYTSALSESDPKKLEVSIDSARKAIRLRLEELDEDNREREQLDRAQHALFTLPSRKRSA